MIILKNNIFELCSKIIECECNGFKFCVNDVGYISKIKIGIIFVADIKEFSNSKHKFAKILSNLLDKNIKVQNNIKVHISNNKLLTTEYNFDYNKTCVNNNDNYKYYRKIVTDNSYVEFAIKTSLYTWIVKDINDYYDIIIQQKKISQNDSIDINIFSIFFDNCNITKYTKNKTIYNIKFIDSIFKYNISKIPIIHISPNFGVLANITHLNIELLNQGRNFENIYKNVPIEHIKNKRCSFCNNILFGKNYKIENNYFCSVCVHYAKELIIKPDIILYIVKSDNNIQDVFKELNISGDDIKIYSELHKQIINQQYNMNPYSNIIEFNNYIGYTYIYDLLLDNTNKSKFLYIS